MSKHPPTDPPKHPPTDPPKDPPKDPVADIQLMGATPTDILEVRASVPAIDGRRVILTPNRLTYPLGTKVSFEVVSEYVKEFPDELYGKCHETYSFLKWESPWNVAPTGKDTRLSIVVERPEVWRALYARSPKPLTPTKTEVRVIEQQLFRVLEQREEGKSFAILINDRVVPILGRMHFSSEKNAINTLKAAITTVTTDWINQCPAGWKEWTRDEAHRNLVIEHWLKTSVRIIPVSDLRATAKDDNKPSRKN